MAENDNDFREVIDGEPVDEKPDTKPTDDKDSGTDEKKDGYEDVCYICRRPESVAGKMIHSREDDPYSRGPFHLQRLYAEDF